MITFDLILNNEAEDSRIWDDALISVKTAKPLRVLLKGLMKEHFRKRPDHALYYKTLIKAEIKWTKIVTTTTLNCPGFNVNAKAIDRMLDSDLTEKIIDAFIQVTHKNILKMRPSHILIQVLDLLGMKSTEVAADSILAHDIKTILKAIRTFAEFGHISSETPFSDGRGSVLVPPAGYHDLTADQVKEKIVNNYKLAIIAFAEEGYRWNP